MKDLREFDMDDDGGKVPLAEQMTEQAEARAGEQALVQKAKTALDTAKELAAAIVDDDTYTAALEARKGIHSLVASIKTFFKPMKDAAHKAHRAVCDRESETLDIPEKADKLLKDATTAYDTKRRAEAEKEQAERDRVAREQEETRRLAMAAEMEKVGMKTGNEAIKAAAQTLIDAPVPYTRTAPVASTPKVSGVSYVTKHKARVTDVDVMIAGIASGAIPKAAIIVNQSFLNDQAEALKFELKYPGVEVYTEQEQRITGRGKF